MNKKLLICGLVAATLVVTACVKKKAPKEEETQTSEVASQPAEQFQSLESVEQPQNNVEIPTHIEAAPSNNSESHTTAQADITKTPDNVETDVKPTPAKPEAKPAKAEVVKETAEPMPKSTTKSTNSQSEADAIAAAMAAAAPALKN